MKILDRYIIKNFLIGYVISFCVFIGLIIIIDLFVNLDEFTERSELDTAAVIGNILRFYAAHITLYFRDLAGVITVVAAVFSLGKMVRSSELVAVMASGVSLKRVIAPIILLSILLTGLLIIDQEFLIPPLSDKLVRSHDAIPGQESYAVWFISDEKGSLINTPRRFNVKKSTIQKPLILLRRKAGKRGFWNVIGCIAAEKAVYNHQTSRWDLIKGRFIEKGSHKGPQPITSYASDVGPEDIPVRHKSKYKTLLSWHQLAELARQGPKIRDQAQLQGQKHFRVTDPLINLVMLMVSLPILVCRDPKSMKSAIMISFGVTLACFITTFICKMFATEAVFDKIIPQLWAWMPIFVFAPIAFIEMDSMKT